MKNRQGKNLIRVLKLISATLSVIITLGIATPAFSMSPSGGGEYKQPVMVSLGDSYSSGEGIDPYYFSRSEDKYEQPDWIAHRSMHSWAGKLKLSDSKGNRLTMYQNKAFYSNKTKSYASFNKNNWYFVAASGAVTASLRNTQTKSYDRYPENGSFEECGSLTLDNQLKVFESIEPGTTDYVTMTMGGNDAHFADVFIYAAVNSSFININGMDDYLDGIWNEFYNGTNSIKNRLIRAYEDIHRAAGNQAKIIIAGYPKILPEDGYILFSEKESRSIDNAITGLNREIAAIVQSLYSDTFKIYFVSVEEAFEGHEIYTGNKAYINGIEFVRTQDLSHSQIISSASIHPNKSGAMAYASCVQKCIDKIEKEQSAGSLQNNTQEVEQNALAERTANAEQESENTQTAISEEYTPQKQIIGDINRDGCVSVLDIAKIISSEDYGSAVSPPHRAEDLNADGVISEKDVEIMVRLDIYSHKK